jgi:hypothetical protein
VPQQTEPTLEQVVHLVTEAAREEISEGSAIKELLSFGIDPAAREWLDVLGWVREADDLEDGTLDVLTLADEKVYDVDAFRRLHVDLRRCDVQHAARQWLDARHDSIRKATEYGVAYPDGKVVHTFLRREPAEQKAKRDVEDGATLVEQTVTTIKSPWRPARPRAAKPQLAVVS